MADGISSLQVVVEGKDETTKVLKGIESSIIRFVGAVSASLAAISVAVFPVKAAATFQRELLNVGKTTDFTDSQISTLGEGLKALSYQLNISADDLAKIAAAGGQLGLGREGVSGLLAFTEAASRMSSVLDITAEESGDALARLTNIFKININEAERIDSLLNEISNNSTAKGVDLIDMVQRIGTAGGTLGIKQSAALAATGRDLGLTVETVGTSFNKVFLSLQTNADQIAPVLGMPVEQFSSLIKSDGIAALKLYINALNQMGNTQRAAFAQQTTGGGRIFALVTSLAKDASAGYEILDRNLASAVNGFDSGTSAIKEQERVMSGLIAQGVALQNVFIGIAEAVGRRALPYLTQLAKQLQVWAKDPSVLEFFNGVATYIGYFADGVIVAIKAISSLSVVMGPLLTLLQAFLGIKIVGGILGIASSLVKQGKVVADTTKAWYGLLTANRATVQGIASAAKELEASNAKIAASGGTGAKGVSTAGKVATYLDTAFTTKSAELAKQTAEMATAEQLLTDKNNQRLKVLGSIRAEMQQITTSSKAQAQSAYDAVVAAGGTKKAAALAKRDVAASLNRRRLDLSAAESNLDVAFDASIKRREANLQSIATQAGNTRKALAGVSGFGTVFTALRTTILSAASAVSTFFLRFVAIGGAIASVIGLATFFLDILGLLDPVTAGLKRILGITDSALVARQRAASAQAAAVEKEKQEAAELSKVYLAQQKVKEEAAKAGTSTTRANDPTASNLAKEVKQLQIINGHYATLTFKTADIAASTAVVETQWIAVNKQLADAKGKYASLAAQQAAQNKAAALGVGAAGKPFGGFSVVSEAEVATAKARVGALENSLSLLEKARSRFRADSETNAADILQVTNEAVAQAERIAPLFDAGGLAALKAFEQVLEGQTRLADATKALDEAAKAGHGPNDSQADQAAYLLAEQNVKVLTQELNVLQSSYDEVRTSTANAVVFMANAFPDAAQATVTKVQALIRILGGLGEGTNLALEDKKKSIEKQLEEIDAIQAKADKDTSARILATSSSFLGGDFKVNGGTSAIEKIEAEARANKLALDARKAGLIAIKNQIALETVEATRLGEAYATAKPTDAGQDRVATFATTAALKELTTLQVEAQKKVVEGAQFSADTIRKLYEEAKTNLSATVSDAKKELAGLGDYFASRNVTLKVANFDFNQNQDNEAYKKFQADVTTAERERLTALGLSSAEIEIQMGMLQESFVWTDKMRAANQDEARQRLVISEIQKSIRAEQDAITDASAKAVEYAKQATALQGGNDVEGSARYAQLAQVEAEKAKIATEGLVEKVKEFKAEAAKPVTGAFGAKFLVSDDEISAVVEASAKARVESAQATETALNQANVVATKGYQDQESLLKGLSERAVFYQTTLEDIAKLAPGLAKAQDALADKVLSGTEGMKAITDSLKSIANEDFRGLDQFATISAQSDKIDAMQKSMQAVADTYATSVVPIGASFAEVTRAVVTNLSSVIAGGDSISKLKESLATGQFDAVVAFPSAVDTLQEAINTGKITVPLEFTAGTGGAIQRNAEGGPIRGPGTGTSDSILSWVSTGEYINDAQTTSFFGDNFFRTLKSIARGGSAALSRFSTKVAGGVSLPAFAGGGYIGSAAVGAAQGIAGLMPQGNASILGRYAVDLNVGGERVSLLGDRTEVDKFINALHKVNRG